MAVSDRVRREFQFHHGLEPARTVVIPNGASFDPPTLGRTAWRSRHGISESAPVLLTIGRRDYVKGYDLLSRAWERVRRSLPGAIWVTAGGDASDRDAGRLTTGPIPRADVREWIHAADTGALPSYYEGCSVALLEMLAGGLPTLAHDVGNASEVIRPGANGAIIERDARAWSQALLTYLSEPMPRPREGLGPEYGWDAIAKRVEGAYLANPPL